MFLGVKDTTFEGLLGVHSIIERSDFAIGGRR
jgi:hypothetical protein